MTVHYVGTLPNGIVVSDAQTEPQAAVVRGPMSLLAQVAAVHVDVTLPSEPKALDEMVRPTAVNAGGVEVAGLAVAPNLVRLARAFRYRVRQVSRLFGTDGVRGVANRDLTPELAYRLGRVTASLLAETVERAPVIIGRDTRLSGSMLEAAIVAGITSVGRDTISLGIVPTPAVACVTKRTSAAAGVVISASHNPIEDNGIKFFGSDGFKFADAFEDEIEELIDATDLPRPIGAGVGKARVAQNLARHYYEELYAGGGGSYRPHRDRRRRLRRGVRDRAVRAAQARRNRDRDQLRRRGRTHQRRRRSDRSAPAASGGTGEDRRGRAARRRRGLRRRRRPGALR